jgi:hypothetical protein
MNTLHLEPLERPGLYTGGDRSWVLARKVEKDADGEDCYIDGKAEIRASKEVVDRIVAAVNFCAGAPDEALKPGRLVQSFKALLPGGSDTDVLTLTKENERLRHSLDAIGAQTLAAEILEQDKKIKELEEMVAGRDQNISERATENEMLKQEITSLKRRLGFQLYELRPDPAGEP